MERWLAFVLLLCLARADAFCPSVTVPRPGARSFASRPHPLLRECHDGALQLQLCKLAQRGLSVEIRMLGRDDEDGMGENDEAFALGELASRIREIEAAQARSVEELAQGVQLRAKELREADELEAQILSGSSKDTPVSLPVVVFDALLPNQRLEGSTDDPTFW
jgi:hypothetical protein